MRLRSSYLARRGLLALCAASMLLAVAVEAQARTELLRWAHPSNDVQLFEVRVNFADGSTQILPLGVPTLGQGGIYEASVEVGDGDVTVALRATGPNSVQSAWSVTQTRLGSGSPPAPTPDPGGSTTVPVGGGSTIPPTVGAEIHVDFSTDPVGNVANGWVDTASGHSLVVDDSLFDVVQVGGNHVLHTGSDDLDIHSHLSASGSSWSNFELRGRMAVDQPDSSIGVTTYSGYHGTDTYYRLGRTAGGSIRLEGRPALSCSGTDSGLVPSAGEWIRFELDVIDNGSNNRVRAKVWRQGSTEPANPQIDCVDSSGGRPTQGTFGVWASGPGQKYWDDFEVMQGVAGLPATPPEPPVLLQILPVTP